MRHAVTSVFAMLCLLPAWSAAAPSDKTQKWVEVQTPHFLVMSNDSPKTARSVGDQFEQIRNLYSKVLQQGIRLDPNTPIVIFAVKDEKALSRILPEYWAKKNLSHPSGLFVGGENQNYIALRVHGEGQFPYETIYHEYMHLIIRLNFRHFPTWLNEGFAEFFGNATLLGNGAKLGEPNNGWLYALSRYKLIPLDVLFKVDERSPYYNEADKTGIFYAESWALVHYLMLDPQRQKENLLGAYLRLVEQGADPLEAGRKAFGDLKKLQSDLDYYTRRSSYYEYTVSLPRSHDSENYKVRELPPAEADAWLGDFDLHRGSLEAARAKLQQAIQLGPNLPKPEESMGFLLYRQGKTAEADKYFLRATQLDSRDARAYYYHGAVLLSHGVRGAEAAEAQAALEKAVSLNPALAPAWSALGLLYTQSPATAGKALGAAQRATALVPGEPRFQYNVAVILARSRRYEEAQSIAARLRNSGDATISALATKLLSQLAQAMASDHAANSPRQGRMVLLAPAASARAAGPGVAPSTPSDASPAAPSAAPARTFSMIGTITAAACSNPPQMVVTLTQGSLVMRLHASDVTQVIVKSANPDTAVEHFTCESFLGRNVRVIYRLTTGQSWDGEIREVELRTGP